jgi:TRAP-type C4-dicarboxylate transport system permease small subunit
MKYVNRIVGKIGGAIIALIMLLTVAQVLSRALLGVSIESSIELIGLLLALSVFLGFSPCEEINAHIKVDLLTRRLPGKTSIPLERIMYIIALLVTCTMTYRVGVEAFISWQTLESLPGTRIQFPVYPAKAIGFLGFLLFAVQLFVTLLGKMSPMRHRKKTDKTDGGVERV